MPLPKPNKGEEESDFVHRCMGETEEEFPDESQRAAVCHRQWEEREKNRMKSWYNIRDAAHGEVEVLLYDEIGLFGIPAAEFVKDLQGIKAQVISLHINSPGGVVFEGIAIYNSLKQHPAIVNVTIDGIAASTASFIAQAGDHIIMAQSASMMIHDPLGSLDAKIVGNAGDLRSAAHEAEKLARVLDKAAASIAGIYAGRAGGTEEEWRARMAEESWYQDQEAVDIGLADEVLESKPKVAAMAGGVFNLSKFKNVPKWLQNQGGSFEAPSGGDKVDKPDAEDDLPDIDYAWHLKAGVGKVMEPDLLPEYDFAGAIREGLK
jgi:ATP-dependent protease ClpP protease subunit